MRRYPSGVVLVVLVITLQLIALYALLPGRVEPSGTALQSDSVQYMCYGLTLFHADRESVLQLSDPILEHFNQAPGSCQYVVLDNPLVWQVYPRLLLPASIGILTLAFGPFGALLPSMIFYLAIGATWLIVVYRKPPLSSRVGTEALYGAAGVFPFASFSMMIWPASVLTEGPTTLALMLMAVVLAWPVRQKIQAIVAIFLGIGLLLTRQLWPLVATIWTVVGIQALSPVSLQPLKRKLASFVVAATGVAAAIAGHSLLEIATVPTGLQETQGHLPDTGPISLNLVWNLIVGALASTGSDVIQAASRFDIASPLLLITALAAALWLLYRREWGLALISICAWALGFYSVGFFAAELSDYNSHFRFLVPPIMFTLTAAWTIWAREDTVSVVR
jgi:hypothetical protein